MEITPLRIIAAVLLLLYFIHRVLILLTPPQRRTNLSVPDIPAPPVIKTAPKNKRTHVVVVGGAGMLGVTLTRQLQQMNEQKNDKKVRVVDLAKGSVPNVEYIVASISDEEALTKAFQDAEAVYHVASLLEFNNMPRAFEVNVIGTRRVLNACFRAGVPYLVYTSSMGVVYGNSQELVGDEKNLTYTSIHNTPYSATKSIAELMVLKANGQNGLKTCALRPPGIFAATGEVTDMLDQKMPTITSHVPQAWIYTENASHFHIKAKEAMTKDGSPVPGNFYIISDGHHDSLQLVQDIAKAIGAPPPPRIPNPIALVMAFILESIYKFGGGYFTNKMFSMNVGIVRMTTMRNDISAAKAIKDFNYTPLYSTFEESISHLAQVRKQEKESKKQR